MTTNVNSCFYNHMVSLWLLNKLVVKKTTAYTLSNWDTLSVLGLNAPMCDILENQILLSVAMLYH